MASGSSGSGFLLTPHKLSMCILLQAYALPSSSSPPLRVPTSVRHRLALFVLQMLKAHENFLEPSFEELGHHLKTALEEEGDLLMNQVANRLVGFLSPEDLFTFALALRELLAPVLNVASEVGNNEEEPLLIESNSSLGQFLRRCILAFNLLSFEGTCKLLTDLDAYRQPMLTITGGESLLENSTSKKFDDIDGHQDNLVDDEDYYEYENVVTEASVWDAEKTMHDANEQKAYGEFQILGCSSLSKERFSSDNTTFHRRVQDGGFNFAFGDAPNKGETLCEGLFLRTNAQVEAYMREQADLIEREVSLFSYGEVESRLTQLEKLAPDFHKVHYLRYLNSLSNGDYPAAMDSLHRYFDYSAGKGALSVTGTSSTATTGRFQAGLLALGSMHNYFGHTSQAVQALNEAVGISQQNSDDSCLAHALACLCHLVSEVGVPGDTDMPGSSLPGLEPGTGPTFGTKEQLLTLLKCCLRRATELKLPYLVAFSRLILAKFDMKFVQRSPLLGGLKGSGQLVTSPIDVFKTLKLSRYLLSDAVLNCAPLISGASTNMGVGGMQRTSSAVPGLASNHSLGLSGSTFNTGGSPGVPGRVGPVLGSFLQLAGTSHLLRAASWELYGSAAMVRVSSLIHATCYSDVASADDMSLSYLKLAQHLAAYKSYEEAFAALDMAAKKFPSSAKSRVRTAQLQLIHDRALHRGEVKVAQAAASTLAALASPVSGVDIELKIDATHRHARTLLAVGQFSEAASVAHSLFNLCYKSSMQLESVMALLLIADIHKKAESIVSGLPYALASLTLSESFNLDLVHSTAMVTLAELWLGLGPTHAEKALHLLHHSMTMVLGHGGRELRGRTHLAVARCHLCNPLYSVHDDPGSVLEALQAAAEDFEILEANEQASEAFYLQALVYNALNDMEQRDRAAASFKKYSLALRSSQTMDAVSLPL